MPQNLIEGSISITALLGVGFAGFMLLLLFILGVVIYIRDAPVPREAMFIFRTILALSAGAFGWVIGGTLALTFNVGLVTGQATTGVALAVLIFLVNPPTLVEKLVNPAAPPPGPPDPTIEERTRPQDGDTKK